MVFVWVVAGFLVAGLIIALCGGFLTIVIKALLALCTLLISLATSAFFPIVLVLGLITVVKKVLGKKE